MYSASCVYVEWVYGVYMGNIMSCVLCGGSHDLTSVSECHAKAACSVHRCGGIPAGGATALLNGNQ